MLKETDFPRTELGSLANGLLKTFIQRQDLYARQLENGSYVCVQKPLETRHVVVHLQGKMTLGAYLLSADSRARYIVFDADDELEFEKLIVMAERLAQQDCSGYLEGSRRGGHLWLFFERPVSGKRARIFGKGLSQAYELEGIELFPKQSVLKDGPGSLVRLPFGLHRKSMERYGFYAPDGNLLASTLTEQVMLLSQPHNVPRAVFESYLQLGSGQPKNAGFAPTQAVEGPLSQRIKDSISAGDFIGRYVVLSPTGRGLCPFHNDTQQSFSVNPEKNYWYCFAGCGGGSIIDFWMKRQGCEFKQALQELADMLLSVRGE